MGHATHQPTLSSCLESDASVLDRSAGKGHQEVAIPEVLLSLLTKKS
jgi:hypothetical protein